MANQLESAKTFCTISPGFPPGIVPEVEKKQVSFNDGSQGQTKVLCFADTLEKEYISPQLLSFSETWLLLGGESMPKWLESLTCNHDSPDSPL